MDDGKRFTSLTFVEEDLFEAGESTDGESEDLDELIFKAENSQHLWLNCDSDENLADVDLLHKKLKQKDEGLHLTAKIGKKLLINTNRLTCQNMELKAQVLELKEELSQLKYLQSSKGRSFQCYDVSDDEDEGTYCRNHSLSPHSNASSHISLSTSLEETFSLRRQIEQLQLNNLSLRDELKALQQEALDEMDQLKEHYNHEFLNARKLIGNLEKKIENGEIRFLKFEYETKIWRESVEALAAKCNLHECEIDELQSEISKIKLDQKEEKDAMHQLVRENAELKELISDLKHRVHDMEQISQPKVLRHVPDSSSPYVDSKSFTQELEQKQLEDIKDTRVAMFCHNPLPVLPHSISHVVCHPENIFARLREMCRRNITLKLGQPGRPGSNDLELAVSGFPPDRPFSVHDPLFTSKSSISLFGYQFLEALFSEKINFQTKDVEKEYDSDRGGVMFGKANLPTSKTLTLSHSKFLQNWSNLGTPDLSTIFRKQSGVWIKGVAVGEVFIEENFARIGLEAEEDDLISCSCKSSNTDPNESDSNGSVISKSKYQYKVRAFVSTHKSLEDIAKRTFDGILSPLKSCSLSDMSPKPQHHISPLGLNCLWSDTGCSDAFGFGGDFSSSMKIVKSSRDLHF